jgi:uncharacterized protein (DUF58 family)
MASPSSIKSSQQALHLQAEGEQEAARLPALLLAAEKIAETLMLGLHGRHRAGPGETFWQYRPYDVSDDRKMIDWRQSARSPSRLYIRQTEWESADIVYIWTACGNGFDFRYNDALPEKQQRAELIAAALAILLNRAGERIGLLDEKHGGPPLSGRDAPQRFVTRLIQREENDGKNPPPLPQTRQKVQAVYLGDFYQPLEKLSDWIRKGSAQGIRGTLMQICDPSEEDFPFEGRLAFYQSPDEAPLVFGNAAASRIRYQQRFLAHRQTLSEICRRHGWRFLHHRTSSPSLEALLGLHNILAGES